MAYLPPIKKRGITHTIVAMYNPHHCGEINLWPKLRPCHKAFIDYRMREQRDKCGMGRAGSQG